MRHAYPCILFDYTNISPDEVYNVLLKSCWYLSCNPVLCLFSGAVWVSVRVSDSMHQQLCRLWQLQIDCQGPSFTSDIFERPSLQIWCDHSQEFFTLLYLWLNAKETQLQCVSNRVTSLLRWANGIMSWNESSIIQWLSLKRSYINRIFNEIVINLRYQKTS